MPIPFRFTACSLNCSAVKTSVYLCIFMREEAEECWMREEEAEIRKGNESEEVEVQRVNGRAKQKNRRTREGEKFNRKE